MKTLIVYASKYGTTKSCATEISNTIDNSQLVSINELNNLSLVTYNKVIIGTSMYFGRINKDLLKWLKANTSTLIKKELHFFTCSKETTLEHLISKELLDHATQNTHFGYALKISQMSFLDKFVSKKIAQTSNDVNHLKPEQINLFIMGLKSS